MAKPCIIMSYLLPLVLIILTLTPSHAIFSRPISKGEIGLKDDQTVQTHLTFYFHDVVSGSNPTVQQIAKAPQTSQSPTQFGALAMIDDALTEGPESTSKPVGRAQGMYASSGQSVTALTMVMNFLFTEGQYNGTTLAVLGRNPVGEGVREMPVVGGTGTFRFAKGYAQARTQTLDQKTGNAVVKYDVYVSHSSSPVGPPSDGSGGSGGSSGSSGSPSNRAPALRGVSFSTLVASLLLIIPLVWLH